MKESLQIILLSGMLTSFSSVKSVDSYLETVKELAGYKLIDTATTLTDFNLWVVTNAEAFDKTFIAENSTAARPRFYEEWVLAAKVQTVNHLYIVSFQYMKTDKDVLNVYFKVQKDKKNKLKEAMVSLVTVPKNKAVRKVNFFHDHTLVRTVPIVTVY